MNENITLETVYVNEGVIYKTPINNLSEVGDITELKVKNLSNNEESEYVYQQSGGLVSVKTEKTTGETKIKTYDWLGFTDESDISFDNATIQGRGYYNDALVEIYYVIYSPYGVEELASHYLLEHPLSTVLKDNFEANFSDWSMLSMPRMVIASVKFDINNSPIMLKLYRGGYMPTDTEIQEAKDYWANVPS